jgi:deazaflavin-dependent oxidoreductase (nitroreductase family)
LEIALYVVGGVVLGYVAIAAFERVAPRRVLKRYWKILNPMLRPLAGRVPGWVLLETVGRRSGRPFQTPVGGRVENGSLWLVVGHAAKSQYLRNIEANPRVRVRARGRWRAGTAHVLPDDNPRRRTFRVGIINGVFIRIAAADLMTVRIDLD